MPVYFDEEGNRVEFPENPNDLRNKYEAEKRRADEAAAKAEAAESRAAQMREPTVKAAFSGYPEGAAKAFLALRGDAEPTEENIASFVAEFGYAKAAPANEPAGEQTEGGQAPDITMQPEKEGGPPDHQKVMMTREEVDAAYERGDVETVNRAFREGRITWNNPDGVARTLAGRGLVERT